MNLKSPSNILGLRPVGEGGWINPARVIAAGHWGSAPIRRTVQKAQERGTLIDLRYGQACTWVLFLDSGHVVLTGQEFLKSE